MISSLAVITAIGVIITSFTAGMRKLCGFLAFATVLLIGAVISMAAVNALGSEFPVTFGGPVAAIPAIGAFLLIQVDKLSAVFLLLIAVVSSAATLYSIGYMEVYKEQSLSRFYPFLIVFVSSMAMVVCVTDFFFFLVFWEAMTLASYFLVVFDKEDPVAIRAGFKYFLMTHVATAFMIVAALILQSNTGSFGFDAMKGELARISATDPLLLYIILGCFFIGFATKAGVYPLGTWLPDAHPAAPSGVSAILSGVMIKMGVYGMVRVFLCMLPASTHCSIWGGVIATFGVLSMVMGTAGALLEKDAKRLLAFSSIAQVGYIFLSLGIGIGLMKDHPVIATVSLVAALFHVVNHAMFKSLAFLNAGSIILKTGTRDLNKVGGLWAIIPMTALTAVVAAMSISGLPPLNGFASKWLIYQSSILAGMKMPLYILFGVLAIFISALTMAYFIKFICTAFYSETPEAIEGKVLPGLPLSMNVSQGLLALLCVVIGLTPLLPISAIHGSLVQAIQSGSLPQMDSLFGGAVASVAVMVNGVEIGVWSPVFLSLVLLGCLVVVYLISTAGGAKKREVPVWLCGEEYSRDQVRYKAHGFYLPIKAVIEKSLMPKLDVPEIRKPEAIYKALDFDRMFYYPLVDLIINVTHRFRKSHVGTPQFYMLWQTAGIILVLVFLFVVARLTT